MTHNYIKSPLNYTGGKHKLLKQIIPLFPRNIDVFYDLFSGGCDVSVNVDAKAIVSNDINKEIIELYNYFKNNQFANILEEIGCLIEKYELSNTSIYGYEYYNCNSANGLSSYNKERYVRLREEYNKKQNPILFFTLIVYAFNHQIRFNKRGEYNLPVGKRDFNKKIKDNLKTFIEKIQSINIEFIGGDYREIHIKDGGFLYIDPPYLASTASYNESNGWNEIKEKELLQYLDEMNKNGHRFALSNVFSNKDKTNEILIEWAKNYKVHFLNHSYSNSNYQAKNRSMKTVEVLITNY